MTQIDVSVKVPENQLGFFLDLLKKLGYAANDGKTKFHQWQIDLIDKRMKEYNDNPYPLRDAKEVLDEMIKKL